MKTLQNWLFEAKGMPDGIKERNWIISKLLLSIEGKTLGPDGIVREKRNLEKARQAYDEMCAMDVKYGTLSAGDLANICWEPFACAVWNAFVKGMEDIEIGSKQVDKFSRTAKWLVPLLTDK